MKNGSQFCKDDKVWIISNASLFQQSWGHSKAKHGFSAYRDDLCAFYSILLSRVGTAFYSTKTYILDLVYVQALH